MRISRFYFQMMIIGAAAVAGGALGYAQDNLTQSLPGLGQPAYLAVLIGGIAGWLLCMAWWGAALRFPALRLAAIPPGRVGMIFFVTLWFFTGLGGMLFFVINGMDYLALYQVILISVFAGTAYNFVIIVLPMALLRAIFAGIDTVAQKRTAARFDPTLGG